MPEIADRESARGLLLPLLDQEAEEALKVRGILSDRANGEALFEIRVDDVAAPSAALIGAGPFFALYAAHQEVAEGLLDELGEARWAEGLGFAGLREAHLPLVASRASILWQSACWQYHLPRPQADLARLRACRGESPLGVPRREDVALILRWWPYGDPESPDDRRFIERRLGSGLASAAFDASGSPVSWAMAGDDLSMGLMHTLEGARGQGHGMRVAADLAIKILEAGQTPYCYVIEENAAPLRMIERMGFVRSSARYFWLGTAPKTLGGDR